MAAATAPALSPIAQPARAGTAPARPSDRMDPKRLLAFVCMTFGMFMAILDIQIVSASLAEIQAGLSASAEEVSWVQTSYLVAEVIMIPLSGILSRALSTRWFFVASAAGFTVMSFMCATASGINQMIVYRALQGFLGGGMIPTVFAAAYSIFPPSKRPVVTPVIGLVATLAPTIGPTVGGYLTDLFSWHWLFLVNVIPGIGVTIAAFFLIDFDKAERGILKNFDWTGLVSMAVLLGALEYALEEGPQKNWFDEDIITVCVVVAVLAGSLFFWRAFTAKQPIVDLSAFKDRNFWTGSLFSFVLGIALYGLTYLYPVYLARVRGYSPLQIGETVFVSGVCMFIAAPIIGRLMGKVDPRLMMLVGFVLASAGTWQASFITKDWAFWELLLPQCGRGFGLMMLMLPINNLALGTLPPARLKNASGLFNLTRNFGGAVGLALINTLMNDRLDLHLQRLRDGVNWSRVQAQETLDNLAGAYASMGSDATLAATKRLGMMVRREALTMALGDVFLAMTWMFLLLMCLLPLMRRPRAAAAGGGGH